jgi:zinc protease
MALVKRSESSSAFALSRCVLAFAIGALVAKTGVAAPERVAAIEGVTEYRLENGVRILLFPDPSKPKVTVNMTVLVGSRHEGYGEAGMAHLLEHMVFKGTPKNPLVPKALKDHGAAFNGTTSLDRTNYFETLPATPDNLEFAIALEADRLVNSFVKKEDLDSEMTVVRNEFERGENSPSLVLDQRMMAAAFQWHNYGKSTIGNRADIERVPIDSLRRFYKKYYQPDNVVVIVAGSFDPKYALKLIEQYFGAIPRPERKLEEPYTEEPAQDGEKLVTLGRVGKVGISGALYHIPSGSHPEYEALDVLAYILSDSPSGRLYKALVETKMAADVTGGARGLHDPGVLQFAAQCNPGVDPHAVLAKMLEVIEATGDSKVTDEEVERAKRSWLKEWELSLTESTGVASQLSEWASQGDWRLLFLYRDRMETVTADDVVAVAKKYLVKTNRTAGVFVPTESSQRASIPSTPNLAEMIGDYHGREAIAEGESIDVSPEGIERKTTRKVLPSGVKAAFLPKKTRGEQVVLQLTLRYGSAESLAGLKTATETLPSLMMRGTKSLTRQQIQDELDKNKARLQSAGGAGEVTFQLETRRKNLAASLDILRQVLREATLPAEELELIRNELLSKLEQDATDPSELSRLQLSRLLAGKYAEDDVRYVPTVAEQLARTKELKRDDVLKLYRDFLNGTVGEISIVGDFDVAETQPLVEKILADWTVSQPYKRIPQSGDVELSAKRIRIETPDKENATYLAGSVFPMDDLNADYPGLFIGNYVLGSSGLASRLGDRVRQKEGLSYGVGSAIRASAKDERTVFSVFAITNPANIDKVEAAIREEVDRLLKDGVTQQELDDGRKSYLESQIVARSDDRQLASILNSTLYLDRTMQRYVDLEKAIKDLTISSVSEALKWIQPQRIVIVEGGDFAKQAAAAPADAKAAPAAN